MIEHVLATFRLSLLLVQEDGPYSIFAKLRQRAKGTEVGKALQCVWCTSVWAGLVLVLANRYAPWLTRALAGSAGAIVIYEWLENQGQNYYEADGVLNQFVGAMREQ